VQTFALSSKYDWDPQNVQFPEASRFVEEEIFRTIRSVSIASTCQTTAARNHQAFGISGMLQRMIASAGVTADEREWEDTDIIMACFASGRT
jgi:hypothetical protein